MATVLLIDDDAELLDALATAFSMNGHTVLRAGDGVAGIRLVGRADVVVSDVNLPGLDGFSICRQVRAEGSRVPILLLTARDSEIDEALGLDLGADDYVAKPVGARVLLSRVAALLRRAGPAEAVPRRVGELILDRDTLVASWRGVALTLTVTEFRMLDGLVERPGVVRSRDWLMERGRGDDSTVDSRIVDAYVRRLRRKFEGVDPAFSSIETVIGAGYRWR